jgi:hypothetical protein
MSKNGPCPQWNGSQFMERGKGEKKKKEDALVNFGKCTGTQHEAQLEPYLLSFIIQVKMNNLMLIDGRLLRPWRDVLKLDIQRCVDHTPRQKRYSIHEAEKEEPLLIGKYLILWVQQEWSKWRKRG